MPIYRYSALSSYDGTKTYGALIASDYGSAHALLSAKQLRPLTIKKARLSDKKVELEDMLMFFLHMDMQLKCKIRVDKALESFLEFHGNKALKASLADILSSLQDGASLGAAFEKCAETFDETIITLLKSAEETGRLSDVIKNILKFLKLQSNWKNHMRRALAYPLFMTALAILILTFSIYLLAPLVTSLLHDYGTAGEIPIATMFVLDVLPILAETLGFFLLLLLAALCSLALTRNGREKIKECILKIPKIGIVIQKVSLWQFCEILHIALEAKLDFMDALSLAIKSAKFKSIMEELLSAKRYMVDGYSIGESFSRIKFVSGEVLAAILIGEESGNLSAGLSHVSNAQYDEILFGVKSLGQQLSIGLTAFTGLILVIILCGLLLPIYSYVEVAGA
ncbi:MAG: type II secretion system F family protein [Holosporaceae bacterium]|jgi:type II secretory pathway component PulF|nr:type II secretion system F family protein [Holosporaceae bacterium]